MEKYDESITVNGEAGYNGFLTNRRLLLIRGDKFHDIQIQSITGTDWIGKRRRWLLILAILSFITILGSPLGILFIILWLS